MTSIFNRVTKFLRPCTAALLGAMLLFGVACAAEETVLTEVTFFHNDPFGNPVLATDINGDVVWKASYLPYGERLEVNVSDPIGFSGKPYDRNTGLSYFGARYYDPLVGRFIGIDPEEVDPNDLHSFNRYAYGNNNPYKFVDPDGRYVELAVEAVSLGVGVHSFQSNMRSGNYWGAAADGVGVVIDAVMAAIPVAPGVVGLSIKASREGAKAAVKGGTTAANRGATYLTSQLQHEFKYAGNFGVTGTWNKASGEAFQSAINNHIFDSATTVIQGTYKGSPVTHYFNSTTGNNVFVRPDGSFWGAWRLSQDQISHITTHGGLK